MNFLWRIAHHLYSLGGTWKKCARVFEIVSFVIASNAISAQAVIGKGTPSWIRMCCT